MKSRTLDAICESKIVDDTSTKGSVEVRIREFRIKWDTSSKRCLWRRIRAFVNMVLLNNLASTSWHLHIRPRRGGGSEE